MAHKNQETIKTFIGLAKAIDWYDVSLQSILDDLDLKSVNRTQSMILVHIASGTSRPSDIAREMGTSKQNIHAMSRQLIADGIIKQAPDPEDGRSKIYNFAEPDLQLRNIVLKILSHLDRKLTEKIGAKSFKDLNTALSADWGDYETIAPKKFTTKQTSQYT